MSSAAIIVAAGQARRMGFDKLLAPLAGKPVLQWSLDAFLEAQSVDRIVVVCNEERFEALDVGTEKEVIRADGDKERYLSVVCGLEALPEPPTYVAIHDGARPLITPSQIDECLTVTRETGAAALARRVTETLKKGTTDHFTRSTVPREDLWIMETPQAFRFRMLRRAYNNPKTRRMQVTDEVSAVEAIGIQTKLIENALPNLKITVRRDLALAEALMNRDETDVA